MQSPITALDYLVIVLYFVAVFVVAWRVAFRKKSTRETSSGYFLGGRNVGWFVIGASLFASNIGSEHLLALAGSGAAGGVAVAQFEILASLILLVLGWVFVPFYLKSQVYTMPEFLERRYSRGARIYLAWVSIIAYVLTKISVTLVAGGIMFEALLGIDMWTGALIVVVATGLYTVLGGLRAVIYTDLMQTFVLIAGSITVTVMGLNVLGGWNEMTQIAGSSFFEIWKPASDPNFPWTGILFGAPILGVWYWCTDQFIVQRVLSARNQDHARRGTIWGGFLKVLPLFIFVIPGIIAYSLAQSGKMELANANSALPTMIATLLPAGVRGFVLAGFLAALMSSLSSVFNSCSTLITFDVYKEMRPEASERQLVLVGQTATALLVVLGLAWIPFIKAVSGQLYVYLQSVQAYISPPIAAVFLLGVFFKRLNGRGAMASLITGFVLGAARLVAELNKEELSGLFYSYADINFLHFALFLFIICSAVLIVASHTAPEPSDEKLENLTYATASATVDANPIWRRRDVQLSVLLILVVTTIWIYFNG